MRAREKKPWAVVSFEDGEILERYRNVARAWNCANKLNDSAGATVATVVRDNAPADPAP